MEVDEAILGCLVSTWKHLKEIMGKYVSFETPDFATIVTDVKADTHNPKLTKIEFQLVLLQAEMTEVISQFSRSPSRIELQGKSHKSKKTARKLTEPCNDIGNLANQNEELRNEIKLHKETLASLQSELQSMTKRLAEEMNEKIAANETDCENIGIGARPLNISYEYNILLSNSWLDAKDCLDKDGTLSESQGVHFLFTILDMSYKEASKLRHHKLDLISNLWKTIRDAHWAVNYDDEISSVFEASIEDLPCGSKPNDFERIATLLTDSWRKQANATHYGALEKRVTDMIKNKNSKSDQFAETTLKLEPVNTYLSECVALSWKMAIQRPPMRFEADKVDDLWTDKCKSSLELMWGSELSDHARIKYYKCPSLFHGSRLMVKGHVFVEY